MSTKVAKSDFSFFNDSDGWNPPTPLIMMIDRYELDVTFGDIHIYIYVMKHFDYRLNEGESSSKRLKGREGEEYENLGNSRYDLPGTR